MEQHCRFVSWKKNMSSTAINTRQFLDPSTLAPLRATLSAATILNPAPCSAPFNSQPGFIRDPASFADFEVGDVRLIPRDLVQVKFGNIPQAPFVSCNDSLKCEYYEDELRHVKAYKFTNGMCIIMKCYAHEMFGDYADSKVQGYERAIILAIRKTLEANFLLVLEEMQYTSLQDNKELTRWHLDQLMNALEGSVFNLSGLCGVTPVCTLGPNTIAQRLSNYMRSKPGRVQPIDTILIDSNVEKLTGTQFTASLTGEVLPNRGAISNLSENIRNVRITDHNLTRRLATTCFYGIFEQAPSISNTEPFRYANTEETIQLKYGPHVVDIASALASSGRFKGDGTWDTLGLAVNDNISKAFGEKIDTADNELRTLLENAISYDPILTFKIGDGNKIEDITAPKKVADVKGLTKSKVQMIANQIVNNIRNEIFAKNPAGFSKALTDKFKDQLVSLGLKDANAPIVVEGGDPPAAKFSGAHMKTDFCCDDGCQYNESLIERAEELIKGLLGALNNAGVSKTVARDIKKVVDTILADDDVIVRAVALLATYVSIMGGGSVDDDLKKGIAAKIDEVRTMLEKNLKEAKYIFDPETKGSGEFEKEFKAIIKSFASTGAKSDDDVKKLVAAATDTLEKLAGKIPLKSVGLENVVALVKATNFTGDDAVSVVAKAYLEASLATLDDVMKLVNNNIPLPFGVGYLGEVVSENSILCGWNPTRFTARLHNQHILQSSFEPKCNQLKSSFYIQSGFLGDPDDVVFTDKAMMIELMDGAGHGWVESPQERVDSRDTPFDVDRPSLMGFIYGLDAADEIKKGRFDLTGFFRYFGKRIPTHKQQSVPSNKPHWSGAAFLAQKLQLFANDGKALGAQTVQERHNYTQKNLRAMQTRNFDDLRAEPTTLALRMPARKNGPQGALSYNEKGTPFLNMFNHVQNMAMRP